MSDVDAAGATAAGADDPCGGCALADGSGCCGGHVRTLLRSDRAVLAMAGVGTAVMTLAALSVPTSRHVVVLVAAGVTGAAAVATSVLASIGLRRPGTTGDRAAAAALRLLPTAVAGVLVTVAAALVRAVTA